MSDQAHQRVKLWPCFLCELSFKRKTELIEHVFQYHKTRVVKLLMVYHPELRINPLSDSMLSKHFHRQDATPHARLRVR